MSELFPFDSDRYVLAGTLYGENRNSYAGMQDVACVILNRFRSGHYGATVRDVCLHPWQFSCWNLASPAHPTMKTDPNRAKIIAAYAAGSDLNPMWRQAVQVADDALAGTLQDNTGGADCYYAFGTLTKPPTWALPPAVMTAKRYGHAFYRTRPIAVHPVAPPPSSPVPPVAPLIPVPPPAPAPHPQAPPLSDSDRLNQAELDRVRHVLEATEIAETDRLNQAQIDAHKGE